MYKPKSVLPAVTLRRGLIDGMPMRRFSTATQRSCIRAVAQVVAFLERPPDTASADDARRLPVEQQEAGCRCRR